MDLSVLISGDDFGLAIGPRIAAQLELKEIDQREVTEVGKKGLRVVPYLGPVRVTCGSKEAFTGAVACITGVVVGEQLARELGIGAKSEIADDVDSSAPVLTPPSGDHEEMVSKIMIREQALDAQTCKIICDFAQQKKRDKTGVEAVKKSVMPNASEYKVVRNHPRDAFYIHTDGINDVLRDVFYRIMKDHVEPFFGVAIEQWEKPQLLSYEKGGQYIPHADGERPVQKPGGGTAWQRFHNRDISILLYLNDEFTGGMLNFPPFDLKIQPKAGLLVAFPSTAEYLHGAEPTESGDRMVLVTWASAVGTTRIPEDTASMVYMKSFEHIQS